MATEVAERLREQADDEGVSITLSSEEMAVTIDCPQEEEVEWARTWRITPPLDSDFTGKDVDFLPAASLETIAHHLRETKRHFSELRGLGIAILWKRKGGTSNGKAVLAKCMKTPPMVKALKNSTFTIWVAADHCRDYHLTDLQYEAMIFHELLHAELREIENEKTGDVTYQPAIVGHDLEMFTAEVHEYGLWTSELRRAKGTFEQASMPGLDVVAFGVGV
jgi:hypothetical protein